MSDRRTWASAGGKVLSDQVWWLLLFWMPDFFHRQFNLDMRTFAAPLAVVYTAAALGSLAGGLVSGRLIAAGMPVTSARQSTMLVCALLVTPLPLALWVELRRVYLAQYTAEAMLNPGTRELRNDAVPVLSRGERATVA